MEKDKLEQSKELIRMLGSILSEGNDFPALAMLDMDINDLMHNIQDVSARDREICTKAIDLYTQFKNILEDFVKENNIEDKSNN